MRAVRVNGVIRTVWRMHRRLYRLGVGKKVGPFDVLLLTTAGRQSGKPRTVALSYVDIDGSRAVIGSFAGEPRDPAWVLNLRSHASATVTIGRETQTVSARELRGVERDSVAQAFENKDASYRTYRERTTRILPVFVLERQK